MPVDKGANRLETKEKPYIVKVAKTNTSVIKTNVKVKLVDKEVTDFTVTLDPNPINESKLSILKIIFKDATIYVNISLKKDKTEARIKLFTINGEDAGSGNITFKGNEVVIKEVKLEFKDKDAPKNFTCDKTFPFTVRAEHS